MGLSEVNNGLLSPWTLCPLARTAQHRCYSILYSAR
uniref:Uncharacterized protein n=1 Tax=Arundo donax TaxID=35708 RepID=A0A0A9FDJ3_ARUDO